MKFEGERRKSTMPQRPGYYEHYLNDSTVRTKVRATYKCVPDKIRLSRLINSENPDPYYHLVTLPTKGYFTNAASQDPSRPQSPHCRRTLFRAFCHVFCGQIHRKSIPMPGHGTGGAKPAVPGKYTSTPRRCAIAKVTIFGLHQLYRQ